MSSDRLSVLFRSLLLETKDGEWGKDAPGDDSVEMFVVRGTDFDAVRSGSLAGVPTRFIATRNAHRKTLRPLDILIETAGGSKGRPTGKTVLLRQGLFESASRPITCASFARFLRVDPSLANPEYVFWYLQHLYKSGVMEGHQVQHTGIARFQFTKFADSVGIPLPSLGVQSELVAVMSTLDDRIAVLRESNTTLEAIAQTLFKSWFVDFDPVRAKSQGLAPIGMDECAAAMFPDRFDVSEVGNVPVGWKVHAVGEVVDCIGGATPDTKDDRYWTPAEHPWTTPRDLSGLVSPILTATDRCISPAGLAKIGSGLLPTGTLLMSSRAPIGYLAIVQMPVAINQGYIAMPPGGRLPPLFMLFWCRQNMDVIKARANGSTFMEISKKAFRPIPILVPPAQIVEAFHAVGSPLFARMVENERQAQTISAIRDLLLRRLISGKLRLPDAEAEAVLVA